MPDSNDEKLVETFEAVLAGDPQAPRRLDALVRPDLQRFFRRSMPADVVDDLAQETLLQLLKDGHRWTRRGSFRGFIFGIARNMRATHLKRSGRRDTRHRAYEIADIVWRRMDTTPSGAANRNAMLEQFAAAFEELPEPRRTIVDRRLREDARLREIGEELGMTEKRVSYHYVRALRELRAILET